MFNKKKNSQEQSDRKQYLFVIRELTSREIKRKYARSYLGVVWSVLNPLMMMAVMSVIFSYMFKRSIENYPVYYLTGSIFFELFSTSTNHAMSALVDNRNLLLKVKLPKQVFILSRIYTAVVNFGYSCLAYVVVVLLLGVKPTWTVLLFPIGVVLTILFAVGIGYILSILYVFFADIKYLYSVLMRILLYFSALFYPVDRLPHLLQEVIGFNPMYLSIFFARECVFYGEVPPLWVWIRLTIYSVSAFVIGMLVFNAKENDVMQVI